MKSYNVIKKEIAANSEKIKGIDKALEEKGLSVESIAEMCKAREELAIINQILRENQSFMLAFKGLEALKEIIKKYDGKSYGDATEKAIYREMHKRGYYFHFRRSMFGKDSDEAVFTDATANYSNIEGRIYATSETVENRAKRLDFITKENKIDFHAIEAAKISGTYCDNPKKQTREILKAYKKYKEKVVEAGAAQSALNALLPMNRDSFRNVNIYVSNI